MYQFGNMISFFLVQIVNVIVEKIFIKIWNGDSVEVYGFVMGVVIVIIVIGIMVIIVIGLERWGRMFDYVVVGMEIELIGKMVDEFLDEEKVRIVGDYYEGQGNGIVLVINGQINVGMDVICEKI